MALRFAWALALAGLVVGTGCADDAVQGEGGGGGLAETGVGAGEPSSGPSGSGGDASTSSTSSSGSTSSTTSSTATGTGGGGSCPPPPACDTPLPDLGPERDFEHTSSEIAVATGFPVHRGRDMFVNPGDPVWIMGKFTYGILDKDLKDEEVDIWMLRDCGSSWERLATTFTTPEDGFHETVEGVEDTGGWVYYPLPSNIELGLGRHRFELVVGGDLSTTSVFIEVVEPGTPIIVTDVDGTLTTSENEEFSSILTGDISPINDGAADVLQALSAKGYLVYYMSARPEFLVDRTRDFIEARGLPRGLVRTTLNTTGATGAEAVAYKSGELAAIAAKGLVPSWAFGNTASDAEAFLSAGIENRIMYLYADPDFGSRTIQTYAELLPEIGALPLVCE